MKTDPEVPALLDRTGKFRAARAFRPQAEAPPFPVRWKAPLAEAAGPLAAAGDRVVLGTASHFLVSVDARGQVEWQVDRPDRLRFAPVAGPEGRILAVGEAGTVRCVDAEGRESWSSEAGAEHPPVWTPEGGCLVAGSGRVTRLGPEGSEAWTWSPEPHPLKPTRVGPVAHGPDGTSYVATCLELSSPRWEVVALDPGGRELWRRPAGEVRDLEVLPQGQVVAGGAQGMQAFDPSGRPAWSNRVHCRSLEPGPGGTLFVEGWNELDLVRPDGQVGWSYSGHDGRRLTSGTSGFDVAVAPDGTAVLTNLSWDWKHFGAAVTLAPDGTLLDEAREGHVAGVAFAPDGELRLGGRDGLRSVNPGTLEEEALSDRIGLEDEWVQVGDIRLPRNSA